MRIRFWRRIRGGFFPLIPSRFRNYITQDSCLLPARQPPRGPHFSYPSHVHPPGLLAIRARTGGDARPARATGSLVFTARNKTAFPFPKAAVRGNLGALSWLFGRDKNPPSTQDVLLLMGTPKGLTRPLGCKLCANRGPRVRDASPPSHPGKG